MDKPTYTMDSRGSFRIAMSPEYQCGEAGESKFAYECEVEVNRLDDRGFVFDANDVQRVIRDRFAEGRWHASCEMLAGGIVRIIEPMVRGRAVGITASIKPIMADGTDGKRWLMCKWSSECELPIAPIRLTEESPEELEQSDAEWEGMPALAVA